MAWSVDARVAVRFGSLAEVGEDDALLVEGNAAVPDGCSAERFEPAAADHLTGCACCAGRSPAASALALLFQRRARAEVPFFRRIVAITTTSDGDLEVWNALRSDPLASARFRLEDSSQTVI